MGAAEDERDALHAIAEAQREEAEQQVADADPGDTNAEAKLADLESRLAALEDLTIGDRLDLLEAEVFPE